MRATSIVFHQTLTWLLVSCWLFGSTAATAAPSADECTDAEEQGGVLFPVDKLNASIAQDRDRVAQQASLVPWLSIADLQTLIGWLYTVPQRAAAPPTAGTPVPSAASPTPAPLPMQASP